MLLTCAACFGRGGLPPEPAPTDKNVKEVLDVHEYASRQSWQRSGYYSLGDETIDLPVFLAVAKDHTACIIDGSTWAVLQPRQHLACPTSWRIPQR